jgi:hypothetical protein
VALLLGRNSIADPTDNAAFGGLVKERSDYVATDAARRLAAEQANLVA